MIDALNGNKAFDIAEPILGREKSNNSVSTVYETRAFSRCHEPFDRLAQIGVQILDFIEHATRQRASVPLELEL
jgi:hypothetical protein